MHWDHKKKADAIVLKKADALVLKKVINLR